MYAIYGNLIAHTEEQTIIQLSDDNNDGVADNTVIDAAIMQADGQINARVSMRYAVPLDPAPALAVQMSTTLAVAGLYTHRGITLPESLQIEVDRAIALLNRIGDGKAGWGEAVQPQGDRTALDVRHTSQPRTFDRASLKGF